MIREFEVANTGEEELVALYDKFISQIETAKEQEIQSSIALIEQKYADRLERYKTDRKNYVHIETEEIFEADNTNSENTETVAESEITFNTEIENG